MSSLSSVPSATRLSALWDRVRTSYWFVPAVLSLLAAACSVLLVQFDRTDGWQPPIGAWFVYGGDADSARALMAAIIGSMITVVSVVFSVTIVSLTLASGQFGSRLLRMFIRDRGNQIVLGTFIATFVYSLLVMRTVRSADAAPFVPHLSVTFAVALMLASTGLLIYFIHHVSMSIQADQVIDSVAREVDEAVERLFPESVGAAGDAPAPTGREHASPQAIGVACTLGSRREGYVQVVDGRQLMLAAEAHDLLVRMVVRPGAFVTAETTIFLASPAERVTPDSMLQLARTVTLGRHRTLTQDAEYGFDQLVEIAVRALSPGINDPFTAIACLDRLGALLGRLAVKRFPSPHRRDERGALRVIADTASFATFVDGALSLIREHAGSSPAVLRHILNVIDRVAEQATNADQRFALREHVGLVREQGNRLDGHNRATLNTRCDASLARLGGSLRTGGREM